MSNNAERNQLLDAQGNANQGGPSRSLIERIYTPKVCLIIFTFTNLFTYFDRGAIAATLSSIRSDSTIAGSDGVISETKGGLIVSIFMVGYMLACPVFAGLGKWVSVRVLVMIGLSIWCIACFVSGLAQSYAMLVCTRMLVGVGEASFSGFFVTILDNIAPKESRTMWIGIFYCMIPTGTAMGMAACGAISQYQVHSIAGWRACFFIEAIVAAPVIILACLFPSKYSPTTIGVESHTAIPEVDDGGSVVSASSLGTRQGASQSYDSKRNTGSSLAGVENTGSNTPIMRDVHPEESAVATATAATEPHVDKSYADPLSAVKHLICNLDYVLICFGYGMYVFVTGALAVWAISMLTTGPWHLSDVAASSAIGGAVALTGLVGSICGGLFVDKMGGSQGQQGVYKCLLFNSLMMAIALPLGIGAMFTYNIGGFMVLFVCGVFFVFTITAPVNASILSIVRHDVRTYAMSFSVLTIHLIGDFPSPTVSGAIADSFDNGCSVRSEEWDCKNATATNCFWVPPKDNSNGHCVNEFETRNAMVIVYSFIFFAIPVWMWAALRARSRILAEQKQDEDNHINSRVYNVAVQSE